MSNCRPVKIRGVYYPSLRAAAKALNIDKNTIYRAAEVGTLHLAGLGTNYTREVLVRNNGKEYRSISQFSRENNLNENSIRARVSYARRRGRKSIVTDVGLLEILGNRVERGELPE